MKPTIGQKAQFLNLKHDGIKLRASTYKNKKTYTRRTKHRDSDS
jgi:hypothetical protein